MYGTKVEDAINCESFCIFCGVSEAKCHIGITLSICHTLLFAGSSCVPQNSSLYHGTCTAKNHILPGDPYSGADLGGFGGVRDPPPPQGVRKKKNLCYKNTQKE